MHLYLELNFIMNMVVLVLVVEQLLIFCLVNTHKVLDMVEEMVETQNLD